MFYYSTLRLRLKRMHTRFKSVCSFSVMSQSEHFYCTLLYFTFDIISFRRTYFLLSSSILFLFFYNSFAVLFNAPFLYCCAIRSLLTVCFQPQNTNTHTSLLHVNALLLCNRYSEADFLEWNEYNTEKNTND